MDTKYDAIIIGAGIGGLVCGCYLAKAGMKVLIVEKNDKPGGYCSSFERKGFKFNIGSPLGNCNRENQLGQIINDLELVKKVQIAKVDPSDVVIAPDCKIPVYNDVNRTSEIFKKNFPNESKGIDKFFELILKERFQYLYSKLKGESFADLLDGYFKDTTLKTIFRVLVGRIGVSPRKTPALTAVIHLKAFVFDGGYCPKGGLQSFSNALADVFQAQGGDLLLSNRVKEIQVHSGKVRGVNLGNTNSFISSDCVVSNCDATQTFLELVGDNHLNSKFIENMQKLKPSMSALVIFLGLNKKIIDSIGYCSSLWYMPTYNIDSEWDVTNGDNIFRNSVSHYTFPSFYDETMAPNNNESLSIITHASYKDCKYWEINKYKLTEKLIDKTENLIPGLSSHIVVKEIATPHTLYKYTSNRKGALRGWTALFSEDESKRTIFQKTSIEGLFLVGHWVRLPSGEAGLPTAAYTGRNVARMILKQNKEMVS